MKLSRLAAGLAVAAALVAPAGAAGMTLTSTLKPNAKIPEVNVFNGFGCSGKNDSPALDWKGAPKDTKSFALTVYDPDAPTGSGWWHWVVFNIPASTTHLDAGASAGKMPEGAVQGQTDFGKPGYGGPCPPAGDKPHRYVFTVYALKTDKLPLEATAPAAMAGFYIGQNKLASAKFTAVYGR